MASAKQDYEKFVEWIHSPEAAAPPDVRRLANLVLSNFDKVAAEPFQGRRRSIVLTGIARAQLPGAVEAKPELGAAGAEDAWIWKRIKQLDVGPFRGFRAPEKFDLNKRVVLIYGPNGSGKTSMCDAFEYGLMGSIAEAGAKRIDQKRYLVNIHEKRFVEPKLIAIDAAGKDVPLSADAAAHRFLFIEKNRIDDFSRMGSKSTAARIDIIATLFGMDRFNAFVGDFNEDMDQQLTLIGFKQNQLANKRLALAQDEAIVKGQAEAAKALDAEDAAVAEKHRKGLSYADLSALVGTDAAPGRLKQLVDSISAAQPALSNVSRASLVEALGAAKTSAETLSRTHAELQDRREQVSFKALYTAVLELTEVSPDQCPACGTALEGDPHVHENPFDKAKAGLAVLAELNVIEARMEIESSARDQASRALAELVGKLAAYEQSLDPEGPLGPIGQLAIDEDTDWWGIYSADVDGGAASWEEALALADRADARDQETRQAAVARAEVAKEIASLQEAGRSMAAQAVKREALARSVREARERVDKFDATNAVLIKEVAAEAEDIKRDSRIKDAYGRYLILLRRYRDQLPGKLMAGLNDLAMELYNGFNTRDLDADKLSALRLPTNGEQIIEIATRGRPGVYVDALHVLSEGHTRCLGLAILLAKALSVKAPVIIFDDALNAIDTEHRQGIRETIFEGARFADTQIIVTCHSEEFIKDVSNGMPVPTADHCILYGLDPHGGDYRPKVVGNMDSRAYVEKARAYFGAMNSRDALAEARRALEMVSSRIWRWMELEGIGDLPLTLSRPKSMPELRNLCEQLRAKLRSSGTFVHQDKDAVIEALGVLLGIPAPNHIWKYLNTGTHEARDGDDFDRPTVERVMAAIERLNALKLKVGAVPPAATTAS